MPLVCFPFPRWSFSCTVVSEADEIENEAAEPRHIHGRSHGNCTTNQGAQAISQNACIEAARRPISKVS